AGNARARARRVERGGPARRDARPRLPLGRPFRPPRESARPRARRRARARRLVSLVELAGELGRPTGVLADDVEAVALLDDRLDVGNLVPGEHDELRRVAAHVLV